MDSTNVTDNGDLRSLNGDVLVTVQSAPTFSYEASGGIGVSGPNVYREDIQDYECSGGPEMGGEADVLIGVYSYTATGGVNIGGIQYAVDFCYVASGGISVSGSMYDHAYSYVASGGVSTGGGVSLSIPQWTATMSGGIQVTGLTGAYAYYTSGNQAFYEYICSNDPGVTMGGDPGVSTTAQLLIYEGTDGAFTGGSADYHVSYNYEGSGSVYIGGYGSTPSSQVIIVDQWFEWNVLAEINIDQEFEWSFGTSVLYWYQVESCCLPTTCDRFVVDDGGKCQNTMFTTLILAPNVTDVCTQLAAQGITSRICAISQFSKAAYITDQLTLTAQGIDQTCNQKIPVPYCELPQCLQYCIDFDINLRFSFKMGIDTNYIASGGVTIGGEAEYGLIFGTSGDFGGGGMTMGGQAIVLSSANEAVSAMGGGPQIGGTAQVEFSSWFYTTTGGPTISGEAAAETTGTIFPNGGGFQPSVGSCFPNWLTELTLEDEFGTLILERVAGEDVFMGCRQMTLSTDNNGNAPVSSPMRYYFYCGPGDINWKLQMTYPVSNIEQPGAIPGYTCSNFDSAPAIWGATPPESNSYLDATNDNFPIDTMFYFPCYGCQGYTETVSESYYQAYGIGYARPQDQGVHIYQTQSDPGGGMGMMSIQSIDDYYDPGGPYIGGSADCLVICSFESAGVGELGPDFSGVQMGGESDCAQSYPQWYYNGCGGINIGGDASLNTYRTGTCGGIGLSGEAVIALGQWEWANNQYEGIGMGGSASCSVGELTQMSLRMLSSEIDAEIGIGFFAGITYSQVTLSEQNIDENVDPNVPVLVPPTTTIKTSCDCNSINEVIYMQHNLSVTGQLQEFLFRNNLAIPSILEMSYNTVYGAWQTNLHLSGDSSDGTTKELWNMVFNWQCSSVVGGIDQGSPLWNFGAYFNQTAGGEVYGTRLLFTFSQLGPCQESATISFNIIANTKTGVVSTDPRHSVYSSIIQDSIGMFRSPSWMSTPTLSITISEATQESTVTRLPYDYNPIFADT